jgi:PAS domain S-box-containing protein
LLRFIPTGMVEQKPQDHWEDFAENAPLGLQSVGPDGRVLWANQAHLDLLGYDREEVVGSHLSRFHADGKVCDAFLARLAAGETLRDFAAQLVTRGGEVRDVLINANVYLDRGGFHHTRCFIRDVTAHRKLEEALAERARALQEADRLKNEFLATLSHELRTPLNAILGWARLLRGGGLDRGKHDGALATIERNAMAQARLIDDLLDLARIVSGKLALEVRPVDLGDIVMSAVESIRPQAEAKEIALSYDVDRSVGPFVGDKSRLGQVLWNLVTNAVKFTPQQGRVHVALTRRNGEAVITVRDTGSGIDPTLVPVIFDRFRQGETGTARRHGGLGLGLAIARRLVELHGGTIEARSPGRGKGATLTVRLPLLAATGTHPSAAQSPSALSSPAGLAGVRVLVVDDDADTRELESEVLTMAGASVETVGSAEEALASLRRGPVDVLVSDLGLPDVDGFDLLETVRAAGFRLPACALSAYARQEDRQRALAAGYDAHLPKPVDPVALTEMVARLAKIIR